MPMAGDQFCPTPRATTRTPWRHVLADPPMKCRQRLAFGVALALARREIAPSMEDTGQWPAVLTVPFEHFLGTDVPAVTNRQVEPQTVVNLTLSFSSAPSFRGRILKISREQNHGTLQDAERSDNATFFLSDTLVCWSSTRLASWVREGLPPVPRPRRSAALPALPQPPGRIRIAGVAIARRPRGHWSLWPSPRK